MKFSFLLALMNYKQFLEMNNDSDRAAKCSKYKLRSTPKPRNETILNKKQKLEPIYAMELLALNEDCLNEIFKHLNVIDLCSVVQVCEPLKQLTESYFYRKYSKFDFSALFEKRLITYKEGRDIMRNFGPMIRSMTISKQAFQDHGALGHVEERLFKDLVEFCGKTLPKLELKSCYFTSRAVEALNMLSNSLQSLTLDDIVLAKGCVFHLTNFTSLTNLKYANKVNFYAFMDKYPALKILELSNISINNQRMFQHFIASHAHLDSLTILFRDGVSSEMIRFIAKNMKSLRTFNFYGSQINGSESIKQIQKNIVHLSGLTNLKSFTWKCYNASSGYLLAELISKKISLTFLQIYDGLIDEETIEAIAKMEYLQTLVFTNMKGLSDKNLIKFAKELTQLSHLYIYWQNDITVAGMKDFLRNAKQLASLWIRFKCFCLDNALYNDFLDIVKERRNGITPKINILSADKQVFVPQETILKNRHLLIIEEQIV